MEIWGYIGAFSVGLILGILGGGGSILTVPVLVYLFATPKVLATSYSLFIVGISSLFGAISYYRKQQLDVKTAFIFAIPSFITIYITRKYLLPAIPEVIYSSPSFELTKDAMIMILLAIVMLSASVFMITEFKRNAKNSKTVKMIYHWVILEGALVGLLTGIVGVGGGFIIVPALTLMAVADADYGYVGTGVGKITLYKGQEVVRKNIPSENAVEALIDLIKTNGDWVAKQIEN